MNAEIEISIVIPAYNEEARISVSLEKIAAYMYRRGTLYELIVVNDGSTDSTLSVVQELIPKIPSLKIVTYDKNQGKGNATKAGVLEAKGQIVFFTDADLSTPIEEIERFLVEIKQADVVIGSRAAHGASIKIHEPFHREILGKLFCLFVRLFCVPGFADTQCGAKMFKGEVSRILFQQLKIARFAFDVELLYLAKRSGFRVKELPITWYFSNNSRVRTFRDGFKMLWDVMKIKAMHNSIKIGNGDGN